MTPSTASTAVQVALPASLIPLVQALAASPELQDRLGHFVIPDEFIATVRLISGELELPFDEPAVRAALQPDPLGISRWAGAPLTADSWPTGDWLPARSIDATPPAFDWAWFGSRRLLASFYEDEVRNLANRPLNLLLRTRTTLESLLDGAQTDDSLPLAGLIFHMSRCGSTLLARMLAAVPDHIVASEPEPLDAVLQWARTPGVGVERAIASVRAIVAALGRRRDPSTRRFFIKLDAWHTLSLPLLRAAFPDVPWVYLFRDPLEVMVSHQRMAGMQTVAGLMPEALFGIERGADLPPLEYAARALDAIGRAALENWHSGGGLAVEYPHVAEDATGRIAAHFGLTLTSAQRAAMRAAAGPDAKSTDRPFIDDRGAKQAEADPAVTEAARLLAVNHARLLDLAG